MAPLDELLAEVKAIADEATPELLPRLMRILLGEDRPGLITCERHRHHLFPYVRAQVNLTRAKRDYYRWADVHWPVITHAGCDIKRADPAEDTYERALRIRDEARKTYRSTTCTCWVQHR